MYYNKLISTTGICCKKHKDSIYQNSPTPICFFINMFLNFKQNITHKVECACGFQLIYNTFFFFLNIQTSYPKFRKEKNYRSKI